MNSLNHNVSPRSTESNSRTARSHRPRSFVALAAFTLAGASLLSTSAHAQAKAVVPPTVVTVTPNESSVQLAKVMHLSVAAAQQIQAIEADKETWTPEQKKLCSDFIFLARMAEGKPAAPGVPTLETVAKPDATGFIKAVVYLETAAKKPVGVGQPILTTNAAQAKTTLATQVANMGGQVLNDAGTIVLVNVPLAQIETLAGRSDISFIDRYMPPRTIGRIFGKSTADYKIRSLVPYLHQKKTPSPMRTALAAVLQRASMPIDNFSLSGLLLGTTDYNGVDTGVIGEGVAAHGVVATYGSYGVSGINNTLSSLTTTHPGGRIRIGVLSSSDSNLAASQTSNDLPPTDSSTYGTGTAASVTVAIDDTQNPAVSQDGTAYASDGEGTAMMQIVHDMIPDAKIFFATAYNSDAQFAKNILLLRFKYNCDIIVDDVGYFNETAFGDGIVAQAVNRVTDNGAMYFSSAGNEGHLSAYSVANDSGFTSSTWEGDFTDGGASPSIGGTTRTGNVHAFNSGTKNPYDSTATYGQVYNISNYPETSNGSNTGTAKAFLYWADTPTGASNDYDIYVTPAAGTSVYSSGVTVQSGASGNIPYEAASTKFGYRMYILKKSNASTRAMHLTTYGAYYSDAPSMQFTTNGSSTGHPTTANGFGVAATPAMSSAGGPAPGSFVSSNVSETFSSDGPRTIFYNVTGGPNLTLAVTPTAYTLPLSVPTYTAIGNGTFAGTKVVRNQPFLTAADGVTSSAAFSASSGLNPFYGTSAAAPHAASIAGLVMSYSSSNIAATPGLSVNGGLLSVADMHTVLQNSTIDIEASGYDATTGYGITMPAPAIAYLRGFLSSSPIAASTSATGETINWTTRLPASTVVNYGTTPLLGNTYTGSAGVTSHTATLTGLIPGTTYYYTITTATATGSATYATPTVATFTTTATVPALALTGISLATSNGTTTATITVANNGSASSDVQVTAAKLGSGNTTTPLSKDLGAMGAAAGTTFTLTFPVVASGRTVLTFSLTDGTGAVFNFNQRVTAP